MSVRALTPKLIAGETTIQIQEREDERERENERNREHHCNRHEQHESKLEPKTMKRPMSKSTNEPVSMKVMFMTLRPMGAQRTQTAAAKQ